MSTGSFETTVELVINGHSSERDVTVRYEYSPAGGDGWHEPRYDEGATLCEVETIVLGPGLREKRLDLLPLLTKDVITALESDCCEHEAAEREHRKCEAADLARDFALTELN